MLSRTGRRASGGRVEPIRIVRCVELNLEQELQVQSGVVPARAYGRTSHDLMSGPVQEFLRSKGLPSSSAFVSLFILLPNEATTWIQDAFGYPFELKVKSVLPDIVLVCSDDVQNAVRRTTPLAVCENLTQMNDEDKVAILRKARLESDGNRAEARMNRAPREEDFLPLPTSA